MSDNNTRPLTSNWRWVRLGDICRLNPTRPKNFAREPDALTDFVPMSAIDAVTGTIEGKEQRPYAEVCRGYTYFAEGDVLFAKITPCMQNGKFAIALGLTDGIGFGTTEFHVLRPNGESCRDWIWLFLRQPSFREEAARHFEGSAGQQRVPDSFLHAAWVPLPPLDEQVQIISQVQSQFVELARMRRAAERQLEAGESLRLGILRSVFASDETRTWPHRNLSELLREPLKNGLSPKAELQGNYRCLTLSAVRNGTILPQASKPVSLTEADTAACVLREGDIFLIRGNGTKSLVGAAGRCEADETKTIYPDTLIRVRLNPEAADSDYFLRVWESHIVRDQIEEIARTTAGIWKVNQEKLNGISVPLPPIQMQREMVRHTMTQLTKVNTVHSAAARQLKAIEALAGALLQEVFGGFEPPKANTA